MRGYLTSSRLRVVAQARLPRFANQEDLIRDEVWVFGLVDQRAA